jgi:hypothetical protein
MAVVVYVSEEVTDTHYFISFGWFCKWFFVLAEFLVWYLVLFNERPTSFPTGALGVYRNESSVV